MRLSWLGYYSDFFVYPLLIAILAGAGLNHVGFQGAALWIATCIGFVFFWTLLEYGLHRFAFHHMPVIKEMHDRHHTEEQALVGSPVWISVLAHGVLVLLPCWLTLGFADASAISTGLMIGYFWYFSVHHILHHWHPAHSGYVYRLKRQHALHHHADPGGNFGVTTGFWDVVFRTSASRRPARPRPFQDANPSQNA